MKLILLMILLIPMSLSAIDKRDSVIGRQNQVILRLEENDSNIVILKRGLSELRKKSEIQENINEKTINGISNQLAAASYSITIFGVLFAVVALILGIYITYIERKVVRIREESKSLLDQTIKNKGEVVAINTLIQKDIYGLYVKIKREETIHLLKRLLIVPKDISNLSHLLLSRELEKEDFKILKEAYIKIKELPKETSGLFDFRISYKDSYKLLFFQHFLDLAIKDKDICDDLIDFYPTAINCAFENDIIKSTQDFMKAIVDLGYQSKGKDINCFINGLSKSSFKEFETVYKIIFNGLKSRDDQFKFFDLIVDEKESRLGKSNYGRFLIETYSSTELSLTEKAAIEKTKAIIAELEKEEQEKKVAEEKKIAEAAKNENTI